MIVYVWKYKKEGEAMKKYMSKSVLWTSICFLIVILYCTLSIISRFSYLDLCYLVVVVTYFVLFLNAVRKV
jgi:hypothetical protein